MEFFDALARGWPMEISDIVNFGLWTALVASIVGLVAYLTWQIVGDGR